MTIFYRFARMSATTFFFVLMALNVNVFPISAQTANSVDELYQKFASLAWIAYAPTHYDPTVTSQVMPTEADIQADLQALYDLGFRGIVTYTSSGIFAEIPRIAREIGFEGVVMGVWDPANSEEVQAAIAAVDYVDGYVVGNEGVYFERYDLETLTEAIDGLRDQTGKPVTTSEVSDLYEEDKENNVLAIGDWLFPNMHPFWAHITDPVEAVEWTEYQFETLVELSGSDRPVVFKEVRLPTAGAPQTSEYRQIEYYQRLQNTDVIFVYFEAFDQPWKQEGNVQVGAHWGLFQSDRNPKTATQFLFGTQTLPVYVYSDQNSADNRFFPAGWMGCTNNVKIDEGYTQNPYSGSTSIQIKFQHFGCPDGWAGIYWWTPANCNWYQIHCGIDLTGLSQLTFVARGEKGDEQVEFKVGGLCDSTLTQCDSLEAVTTNPLTLKQTWTPYTIQLGTFNLSQVGGGFVWVTNSNDNITIYLDEIQFQ